MSKFGLQQADAKWQAYVHSLQNCDLAYCHVWLAVPWGSIEEQAGPGTKPCTKTLSG